MSIKTVKYMVCDLCPCSSNFFTEKEAKEAGWLIYMVDDGQVVRDYPRKVICPRCKSKVKEAMTETDKLFKAKNKDRGLDDDGR